ncbi:discoidin domain-containing protein [Streptomyces sp. NPDC057486]|uniref:galactose-binding domain-containing protein n=1 Tax=Streptomyces sp. NPDC057486 TaxID=3346145 RepID=UPI00369A595C
MAGEIDVVLADGTYTLKSPLSLSPQDSGRNGFKVVWQAAPGAHPVISGGTAIREWTQTSTRGIWSAPVPENLNTRQLYADGQRIPRASGTLGSGPLANVTLTQNTTGGFTASSTTMSMWRNPSNIEFVFAGGNGPWTEPRCDASSISGTAIAMRQPCWDNLHLPSTPKAPDGDNPSGGFPGLKSTAVPSVIENAYELLTPGHWYLDQQAHVMYYDALSTDNVSAMNFVAPALERLMTSTATAESPVHDVTFQGIEFAHATWLQPSSDDGFAEMQANQTITGANGSTSQGLCGYVSPAGSCPFAAWTREPAAVDLVGTRNVSFLNNTFAHLGGAGLALYHGADHDLVKGNEVTDVSGNGIELGATDDPQPLSDVAFGKPASQSSTAFGADASRAVDGNTDGVLSNESVSRANATANAWWQVDLGSVRELTSLNIFTRTDCCGDLPSDYWVFVSPSPFDTTLTPTQQAAVAGMWSSHQTGVLGAPPTIPAHTSGRYVMVQLSGTSRLALAEVQAMATAADGPEIATHNTISDNYVHNTGAEFTGSVGIFGGYSQFTTITHNQISDVSYSGISFGWGGWHTNASTPNTNPNINSDNVISDNVISSAMRVRSDGGSIYTNGPQGTSYAHGLTISGNVTFGNKHTNFAYYNDEGGAYITIDRNVEYQDSAAFNGGCSTTGPVTVTNSYHVGALNRYVCDHVGAPSQFVDGGGNVAIPMNPGPTVIDQSILQAAGLEAAYVGLTTSKLPTVNVVSPVVDNTILVTGSGFTPTSTVSIGDTAIPNTTYLSSNYLKATLPSGSVTGHTTVTNGTGTSATSPDDYILANNLAKGRTASQSSTAFGGDAARAVDGNTDGNFSDGSISHTDNNTNAWWQVDLGSVRQLSATEIFNRTDCCGNRLSDYWVFVSSTPFNTTLTPTQQAAQRGVWSNHQTAQAGSPTLIPARTSGRYVMVQLSDTNYLALAEVVVG